jgi:hypothetical protein
MTNKYRERQNALDATRLPRTKRAATRLIGQFQALKDRPGSKFNFKVTETGADLFIEIFAGQSAKANVTTLWLDPKAKSTSYKWYHRYFESLVRRRQERREKPCFFFNGEIMKGRNPVSHIINRINRIMECPPHPAG